MSLLGGIQVRIGADTSGLESGMKRAGVTVKNGVKQIRQSANQYAKWGAAAGAAATAAAAAIYRSTSQQIDQLAKTSDRLGIATEELQALQFAAEQTGVESRTLEMGLQRMTRRISEAAKGSGEAKDAIKELGLDAKNLSQLPLEQQFTSIAGAMEGVSNQGDKVRLAMRLFDSEGVALINTLDAGEEGLQGFADEAERLGLSLTRVDAARVEAANDAINRAQTMIQGQLQQAVVELAPFIEALADEISRIGSEFDDAGGTALNAAESIATGFGKIGDVFRGVELALLSGEAGFYKLKQAGVSVAVDLTSEYREMTQSIIDSVNRIIEASNEFIGTDFEPLENNAIEVSQKWNDILVETNDQLHSAHTEAIALANEPLPSKNVEDWFNRIREAANEARKEMNVSSGVDAVLGGGLGGFGGGAENGEGEDGEAEKFSPEENEKFLEGLRERFATEAELKGIKLQEDMDRLKEAKDQELLTEEQFNSRKEQLAAKHVDNMVKLAEIEKNSKTDAMSTMFGNLSSLMNTGNKRLFAIGKAAAIADATINAYKGIAKTMAEYPYPLNIGMAAAHGVAAFAQISQIKSQQFGSGGGSPTVYDGGQPAVNTTSGGVQPQQQGGNGGGRNISINLQGSSFTDEQVRDLIGRINDQTGDGVTLATSG